MHHACVIHVNMETVTTREAQHHLSKVLKIVEKGGEVVITRRGNKVARICAYETGGMKDQQLNWSEAIRERNEALGHLPQVGRNWVVELREEERY